VQRYKDVVHHELHLAQMRRGSILCCVLAVFLKQNFAVQHL
jgi:hypothetical protein